MRYKGLSALAIVIPLFSVSLIGCNKSETIQRPAPEAAASATPDIKLPPKFGIYFEGRDGNQELADKPQVPAGNPSFLVYLDKMPEPSKVRLRFHKSAPTGFLIDAGTVTTEENPKDTKGPNATDYKGVLILSYGEDKGVFEPKVNGTGRSDLHRATYSGELKPGEYVAFYFIDESSGNRPWATARFKFAGQFTVK